MNLSHFNRRRFLTNSLGLAEMNVILDSGRYGMTIGHADTDNVIRNNEFLRSGLGGNEGIAIDITGQTKDLVITGNELSETRSPAKRVGIRIGPQTKNIVLDDSTIAGFTTPIQNFSA